MFFVPIKLIGLEGFECDRQIAVIVKLQLIKVISSNANVQILGPIILDPLVSNRAAGLKSLDSIGSGAEKGFQRGAGYVTLLSGCIRRFPTSALVRW